MDGTLIIAGPNGVGKTTFANKLNSQGDEAKFSYEINVGGWGRWEVKRNTSPLRRDGSGPADVLHISASYRRRHGVYAGKVFHYLAKYTDV
ncbi:MAG: hypothetical protein WA172_02985 [Terriglobales bacterium]